MKYWEIIADNLRKAGWNCSCISSTDREDRQFWIVAAEREGDGRFIVRADEKLTAFVELERVMRRRNVFNLQGIEQQIAIAGAAF